jgi:hypothetical protein
MPAPPRFASLPPSSPSPRSPSKEGRHSRDYPPFSPSSALRHPRPHPHPPSLPSYAQVLGAPSPANVVSQGSVVSAQGLVVSQGRPFPCPRRLHAILGSEVRARVRRLARAPLPLPPSSRKGGAEEEVMAVEEEVDEDAIVAPSPATSCSRRSSPSRRRATRARTCPRPSPRPVPLPLSHECSEAPLKGKCALGPFLSILVIKCPTQVPKC